MRKSLLTVVAAVLIGIVALPGGLDAPAQARRKKTYVYQCSSPFPDPTIIMSNPGTRAVTVALTTYNAGGTATDGGSVTPGPHATGIITGKELTVLRTTGKMIISGTAGVGDAVRPIRCVP